MDLSRFEPFFARLAATPLRPWGAELRARSTATLAADRHGDLPAWSALLARLPRLPATAVRLDQPVVSVDCANAGEDVSVRPSPVAVDRVALARLLDGLHPWRKGPFCLHGVEIDAEWRSDRKWARLAPAIAPLDGRLVLDVGCGNGYYGYRALGAGARLVLGIDPGPRMVMQFLAVNHFIEEPRLAVLPLADEQLPETLTGCDTVFSMGVLYHRRDPAQHLNTLYRLLRPGGELLLETLILDQPGAGMLEPSGRYARMCNVHWIPTLETLRVWLAARGFRAIDTVDVSRTTVAEQRATSWMRFQSLRDFLDPADASRTREGYPAPCRAMLRARR